MNVKPNDEEMNKPQWSADQFAHQRQIMVETQLRRRGISDSRILEAFLRVPRHHFVPDEYAEMAYEDKPLPIGKGQTISQPYIVAYMINMLELSGEEKLLEIGTGSGYETAILAELVREVYTVEIISELSTRAQEVLKKLGYQNIFFKVGDGHKGWENAAPFHAIIVSASPKRLPNELTRQLPVGGKLIIPVGAVQQKLLLITRREKRIEISKKIPVRFVPLVRTQQ